MSTVYLSDVDSYSKLDAYTGLPLHQDDGLGASRSTPLLLEWGPGNKRQKPTALLDGVLLKNASKFAGGSNLAEAGVSCSGPLSSSLTEIDEVDGDGAEGGDRSSLHSSFGELLQTRDSKSDQSWMESQKITFTNWVNDRLKAGRQGVAKVMDLSEDLRDGILLIKLLENLTKKKIKGFTKNPKMAAHKLDNLELAIDFMKGEELKLIGIGSMNIFEGNMKLTLGLLWTLIQKYQLRIRGYKMSTKDVILQWVQALIPALHVTNLTSDWADGRALLTLINAIKPAIAPGADSINSTQQFNNCTLATQLAEVHLKIPKIIDAETLASGQMDELSMITYLSYFVEPAQAKLKKWVKRALPHANVTNFTTNWFDGVLFSALLNACFPGILPQAAKMTRENASANVLEFFETCKKKLSFQPHFSVEDLIAGRVEELQVMTAILQVQNGNLHSMPETITVSGTGLEVAKISKENTFSVNTTEAGPGKLNINAYYEDGRKLKFKLKEKVGGVLTLSYTPPTQGRLVFDVRWSDIPIPNSPFSVLAMTPSMIHILDFDKHLTLREAGKVVELKLEMKQATKISAISAYLSYGKGTKVEATVTESEGSTAVLKFIPPHAGNATLQVYLNKRELSHLSVSYTVVDSGGYHIESLPSRSSYETFEEVAFVVHSSKKLPLDVLQMTAILSDDIQFPLSFNAIDRTRGTVSFKPTLPGKYKMAVTCAGNAIQGAPFYIQVTAPLSCKLCSSLPTYLVVNKPHTFELETNAANTELVKFDSVGADPSSNFRVYCVKGDDDIFLLTITPITEGVFMTGVKFQDEWVQGCPFQLTICDPMKFKIVGDLLHKKSAVVGETINFSVESTQRNINKGQLLPIVTAKGPTAKYSPKYQVREDSRALLIQFTPYEIGAHEVSVTYGGFQLPSSPFVINVVAFDSHTFSATGSGLQEAYTNVTGQFIILTKKTGLAEKGILQVKIAGVINGKECEAKVNDNKNGSYDVSYFITNPGAYLISIFAGGTHIPGSPFKLTALPGPNPLKCRMHGPALNESEIFTIGQSIDFTVDATKGGVGKLAVKATRMDGVSARVFVAKDSSSKGIHDIKIDPTHHGKYEVSVKWSGTELPGSPFVVNVFPGVDATKCRAYGAGLENGRVGTLTEFYIETHNAGPGNLWVDIHGAQDQCKIDLKPKDMVDVRTMVARYFPRKPGTFIISVTWSEKHIPGSPFKVKITGEAMEDAFKPNKFKPPVRNDELESIAEAEDEEDDFTDIDFDVSSLASRPRESQRVVQKVPSVRSLDEIGMPSFKRAGVHKGFQETFVKPHTDSMMSKSLTHIAKDTKPSSGKMVVKKKRKKKAAAVKANGPKSGSLK